MTQNCWTELRPLDESSSVKTKISWPKQPSASEAVSIFAGIIYAHQLGITVGKAVNDLEVLAQVGSLEEFANRVEFLPL